MPHRNYGFTPSVLVAISAGDASTTYEFRPEKEPARDEARAWLLLKQGEETVYRLSCRADGSAACTCPGYREHRHGKHGDWLRAWRLAPTPAEALHAAGVEAENAALRHRLADAQEQAELARQQTKQAQESARQLEAALAWLTVQKFAEAAAPNPYAGEAWRAASPTPPTRPEARQEARRPHDHHQRRRGPHPHSAQL